MNRKSFLSLVIFLCGVAAVFSHEKNEFTFLQARPNSACFEWAKARISQCAPTSVTIYDNPTKCGAVFFTLDGRETPVYCYLEIPNNQGYAEGWLFSNSGHADFFFDRAGRKGSFCMEPVFEKIGFLPVNEENKIEKNYVCLTRTTESLKDNSDLAALVELLRNRHKDKFLETSVSKEKFSDTPEEYKKAVVEKIRSHIVEHDLKSRKILEALGAPMPSELRVKIMPFAATNCDFYYMYDNTPKRTLRRVTSNADGGFSPLQETAAGDEAHNADLQWVDHPNTTGGPTLRDEEKVFFKSLEQDGVLITIRLPAREKD